jgi:hypothetical protein
MYYILLNYAIFCYKGCASLPYRIAEGVRAMFDRDVSEDRDWWAFVRIVSYDPEL